MSIISRATLRITKEIAKDSAFYGKLTSVNTIIDENIMDKFEATCPNTGISVEFEYSHKGLNLYQTSDETLKTFTEDLDVNLDNLASIKKGLFYWNSDENKVLDIGVTAQSLEPLFPELVTETDGIKAVSYSKLSVVALAAIDKLYKRVKELEDEVEELKSK